MLFFFPLFSKTVWKVWFYPSVWTIAKPLISKPSTTGKILKSMLPKISTIKSTLITQQEGSYIIPQASCMQESCLSWFSYFQVIICFNSNYVFINCVKSIIKTSILCKLLKTKKKQKTTENPASVKPSTIISQELWLVNCSNKWIAKIEITKINWNHVMEKFWWNKT